MKKIEPVKNPDSGPLWKVKKKDGASVGSYKNIDKAFSMTKRNSPRWDIMGKSQRQFFTDKAAKAGKNSPGPGQHESIDYGKIH